jgi:hypothetical protein
MSKFLFKLDDEQVCNMCEDDFMTIDEVMFGSTDIFNEHDYIAVEGSAGLWNGRQEIPKTIVDKDKLFSRFNYLDMISFDIYDDHVDFTNTHHDGSNHYTFTPFQYDDLTIKEMKRTLEKEDLLDSFYSQTDKRRKDIRKVDYTDYFESNYMETIW